MTVQWGYTVLRLHPLLLFVWALSAVTDGGSFLLPMAAALTWHETGHYLFCRLCRLTVSSVEFTPFGGMMAIEGLDAAPPLHRFLAALGGPLFSLLGLLLLPPLADALPFSFTQPLARHHLLLLIINLLPVPPLDGGRMLRALLPGRTAEKALTWLTRGTALLLCLLSAVFAFRGQLNFAPAFAGLYLLYAGHAERSRVPTHYVSALIGRRQQLMDGKALPVRALAVGPEMKLRHAAALMAGRQYHEVWVLSPDGMEVTGKLDEKAFCDALLTQGDAAVSEALSL